MALPNKQISIYSWIEVSSVHKWHASWMHQIPQNHKALN